MRVHVLASGSTGNAVYIEMGGKRLLVDAGISSRRITAGLHDVGVDPSQLDAIFITHEHRDHIQGLDVFCRRYQRPVYARAGTWDGIGCRDNLPADCRNDLKDSLNLGSLRVDCIPISHDANDPVGFIFRQGESQIANITDIGCINSTLIRSLAGSDIMVLESNHDSEMLKSGPYPPYLKRRISSSNGHLSNLECGRLLSLVEKPSRRIPHVLLAHISQQNNQPQLAMASVEQELRKGGYIPGCDIMLHLTHATSCSSVVLD